MSQSQQFVYHLVPRPIVGKVLYPLNQLQDIAPEIAEKLAQKYVGREFVMQRKIPLLDCLWNDVLMFCPVHPHDIMQTFRDEGYDLKPRRWFKVPITKFERERVAVYLYRHRPHGKHDFVEADFAMLEDVNFESLTLLPNALREHIKIAQAENRSPLFFVGVPHILYKGELPVDELEIVEF